MKKGDSLFFFFSGPGKVQRDQDGDESDGYDECLITSDGKVVVDDEMFDIMVKDLPRNVRLTAVMVRACVRAETTRLANHLVPHRTLRTAVAHWTCHLRILW